MLQQPQQRRKSQFHPGGQQEIGPQRAHLEQSAGGPRRGQPQAFPQPLDLRAPVEIPQEPHHRIGKPVQAQQKQNALPYAGPQAADGAQAQIQCRGDGKVQDGSHRHGAAAPLHGRHGQPHGGTEGKG